MSPLCLFNGCWSVETNIPGCSHTFVSIMSESYERELSHMRKVVRSEKYQILMWEAINNYFFIINY